MTDSLGLYLPAAVGYRLVGLARGVILTWVLTASEFGYFQIATVAVNVLMPLGGLGLSEAMTRYVPQYEAQHRLRAFLRQAWWFSLCVGVLICAGCLVLAEPLTGIVFGTSDGESARSAADRVGLTRWAIVAGLALIVHILLLAILRGLRMFMAVGLLELGSSLLFTVVAVALPLCGWADAEATMVGLVVGYGVFIVIVGLPFVAHLRRLADQSEPLITFAGIPDPPVAGARGADGPVAGARGSERAEASTEVWMQMLRYSIWSAMAGILWQVTQFCPMWYLQQTHGSEATAVFGSARLVAQAVLIAATSVIVVVQSAVTRTWESRGREAADRQLSLAFKVTGLIMLAGCGVLAGGAPLVVRMFPATYAAGAAIVPLLLAFFMVGGHLAFLIVHFVLIERPRYVCALWLVAAVANIAFAVWLIRPETTVEVAWRGASWAGLLGITVALLAALYWMRREHRLLDTGSAILIAATFSLVLPGYVLAATLAVVAVLVAASRLILDADDKRKLRESVADLLARVRRG